IPFIASTELGQAIIAQGIYEQNIYSRFLLMDRALEFIMSNPLRALIGFNHSEWSQYYAFQSGHSTGVHNNPLASLLFLGVIGGAITLLVFYAVPASRVLRQLKAEELQPPDRRRREVAL